MFGDVRRPVPKGAGLFISLNIFDNVLTPTTVNYVDKKSYILKLQHKRVS